MTPEQAALSDQAAVNARKFFDNPKLIQSPLLPGHQSPPILFYREHLTPDDTELVDVEPSVYISIGNWRARINTASEAERRAREAVAIYTGGILR